MNAENALLISLCSTNEYLQCRDMMADGLIEFRGRDVCEVHDSLLTQRGTRKCWGEKGFIPKARAGLSRNDDKLNAGGRFNGH